MTLQEFRERDNNFDETSFITKVNNIVVKFFNSITLNEDGMHMFCRYCE